MSVPLRAVQLNEANAFLKKYPEVLYVDLLIADMNGVVRGKRIERTSLHKVYEKGINLPASLFALDINGSTVESTGLGLDIGDSDRICYPIPNTLCIEPWQKRPTAQLLMTMHELEGQPFFADPREVLRQVVSKFDDMGLTICAAFELEFYLIDQDNVNGRPQSPRSPVSGKRPMSTQVYLIDDLDEYVDCLQDILEGAKEQGIPADAIVKESAPAQFEVNLHHVSDPIKACDYAVLLKRLVKNIAYSDQYINDVARHCRADMAWLTRLLALAGRATHEFVERFEHNLFRHTVDGQIEVTLTFCLDAHTGDVNAIALAVDVDHELGRHALSTRLGDTARLRDRQQHFRSQGAGSTLLKEFSTDVREHGEGQHVFFRLGQGTNFSAQLDHFRLEQVCRAYVDQLFVANGLTTQLLVDHARCLAVAALQVQFHFVGDGFVTLAGQHVEERLGADNL